MFGRLHEHSTGADRGICEWAGTSPENVFTAGVSFIVLFL